LDTSLETNVEAVLGTTVTGASVMVASIAAPGVLAAVDVAAFGVSSSVTFQVNILRFAGGLTSIAVGVSTLTVQNYGVSGMQQIAGFSAPGVLPALAPQSSTLAIVQAGDLIQIVTGGSGGLATANVAVVVKKTQDILSQYGING